MQFIDTNDPLPENSPSTLGIYSRCGMGDLLILRDYLFGSFNPISLNLCPHCGSPVNSNLPYKKYHIRFQLLPLADRNKQDPFFIENFLKPFCSLLFRDIHNLYISFGEDMNQEVCVGCNSQDVFYTSFSGGKQKYFFNEVIKDVSIPDYSELFFNNFNPGPFLKSVLGYNYICVSTRYRNNGEPSGIFPYLKKILYDSVINKDIKIILIGEKKDKYSFKSVYKQCMELIPRENLIDATSENFFLRDALQDGFLMKHARFCIAFGIGGNLVLGSYLNATKIISYANLGETHEFVKKSNSCEVFSSLDNFTKSCLLEISKL